MQSTNPAAQRLQDPHGNWWRALRLPLLASCIALAGCAGTGSHSTKSAYLDAADPDGYSREWRQAQEDPIGMLVAQNLRRERQAGMQRSNDPALAGEALNYLGVRYRYGGNTPDSGFDCSGLVSYVASQSLGIKLPRSAAEISQWGQSIEREELVAGDLVFFNTMGRRNSHVGIYLGDDRFIHSPSAGGVVRIESMTMAYWTKRYNGARRLDTGLMASARAAR
jgi:cell wall-associated NlpC family hydrolase